MVSNAICNSYICSSSLVSCPRFVYHEIISQTLHCKLCMVFAENTIKLEDNSDQYKSNGLVEKKTVINLLEAYAVAVKHYLRKEDGIKYTDLDPFVRFLPQYFLPSNIPSSDEHHPPPRSGNDLERCISAQASQRSSMHRLGASEGSKSSSHDSGLLPAECPRDNSVTAQLRRLWCEVRGDELPDQGQSRHGVPVHNVPLEISFYLVSEAQPALGQLCNKSN